jgi:hypothetical protein
VSECDSGSDDMPCVVGWWVGLVGVHADPTHLKSCLALRWIELGPVSTAYYEDAAGVAEAASHRARSILTHPQIFQHLAELAFGVSVHVPVALERLHGDALLCDLCSKNS